MANSYSSSDSSSDDSSEDGGVSVVGHPYLSPPSIYEPGVSNDTPTPAEGQQLIPNDQLGSGSISESTILGHGGSAGDISPPRDSSSNCFPSDDSGVDFFRDDLVTLDNDNDLDDNGPDNNGFDNDGVEETNFEDTERSMSVDKENINQTASEQIDAEQSLSGDGATEVNPATDKLGQIRAKAGQFVKPSSQPSNVLDVNDISVAGMAVDPRCEEDLLSNYFEQFQCRYPLLDECSFRLERANLIATPLTLMKFHPHMDLLALLCAVCAVGSQFDPSIRLLGLEDAEKYLSFLHKRGLCYARKANYLLRLRRSSGAQQPSQPSELSYSEQSLITNQTKLLLSFFLVNSHHAADAFELSKEIVEGIYKSPTWRIIENPSADSGPASLAFRYLLVWDAAYHQHIHLALMLRTSPCEIELPFSDHAGGSISMTAGGQAGDEGIDYPQVPFNELSLRQQAAHAHDVALARAGVRPRSYEQQLALTESSMARRETEMSYVKDLFCRRVSLSSTEMVKAYRWHYADMAQSYYEICDLLLESNERNLRPKERLLTLKYLIMVTSTAVDRAVGILFLTGKHALVWLDWQQQAFEVGEPHKREVIPYQYRTAMSYIALTPTQMTLAEILRVTASDYEQQQCIAIDLGIPTRDILRMALCDLHNFLLTQAATNAEHGDEQRVRCLSLEHAIGKVESGNFWYL